MSKAHEMRPPCSKETRLKISKAKKGIHFSKEHRQKLSEALKGNHCHFGCHHSDKTRAKMRDAHKRSPGRKGQYLLGHHPSEEAKTKMSIARQIYWQHRKFELQNNEVTL